MHLSANLVTWHCFKEEREDESFIDMKQVTPFPMSMKSGETRTEALQLYLPPFFFTITYVIETTNFFFLGLPYNYNYSTVFSLAIN